MKTFDISKCGINIFKLGKRWCFCSPLQSGCWWVKEHFFSRDEIIWAEWWLKDDSGELWQALGKGQPSFTGEVVELELDTEQGLEVDFGCWWNWGLGVICYWSLTYPILTNMYPPQYNSLGSPGHWGKGMLGKHWGSQDVFLQDTDVCSIGSSLATDTQYKGSGKPEVTSCKPV